MEITLFDRKGHATAYIADDGENSIYLWKGKAVAYVDDETIYGWNGRHLGWFVDGILYDLHGHRVGTISGKCSVATYAEPAKYAKYAKYAKHARHAQHVRAAFSSAYSGATLEDFLRKGEI